MTVVTGRKCSSVIDRDRAQERVDLVRLVAAQGDHEPLVLDLVRRERHVPPPSFRRLHPGARRI
jgi:hypothetical protein